MVTKHSSYRISDDGKQLIKLLSKRLGVNDTSVLELAIRELAEKKGIKIMTNEEMRQETLKVVQLTRKLLKASQVL